MAYMDVKTLMAGKKRKSKRMMYPLMTLDDDTEIVHSHMLEGGRVKVYVEKPDE